MKKIKIIKSIVGLTAILIIVGVVSAMAVFLTLPEGKHIAIGEPQLEITSESLITNIERILPKKHGQAVIKVNKLDMSIPVHLSLRMIVICIALIVAIYAGLILDIIRKIIGDIEHNSPFNIKNISRVKRIGILVCFAPIFEWFLHVIFSFWLSGYLAIDGVKLVFESGLGWPVFLLGLIITVLGIAFEQGRKLQEENELTI
jgi:amino acid transporter